MPAVAGINVGVDRNTSQEAKPARISAVLATNGTSMGREIGDTLMMAFLSWDFKSIAESTG